MKTREWYHVDGKLSQIGVQLTREAETGGDSGHGHRDEVVQVPVVRVLELQGAEADVVQSFVVNAEGLVGVLDELVDGERGVVRLDHGVGHLGGWDDGIGAHNTVGEFFADFGDQEGSHAGASTSSEGVGELESLKAVASFCFLADDVQDGVDEFGSFGVVTLGPVVSGSGLS